MSGGAGTGTPVVTGVPSGALTAVALFSIFRTQTQDIAVPQLWADSELYRWLNEAEVEACRRARLIVDTQNVSGVDNVCRIQLVDQQPFYPLDHRVIYVRRALMAGRTLPLCPMDYRDLDLEQPGWQTRTGQVVGYVRGLDTGKFRPYRIPTTASMANGSTVDLLVVREPLRPMSQDDQNAAPEINPRYHLALLDWVYWRAYSKKDSEAYDPKLSAEHLAVFEAEVGTREKASAMEEEYQRLTEPNDMDGNY
jgi:hypothetical protein